MQLHTTYDGVIDAILSHNNGNMPDNNDNKANEERIRGLTSSLRLCQTV